jgi:hypothetical protein
VLLHLRLGFRQLLVRVSEGSAAVDAALILQLRRQLREVLGQLAPRSHICRLALNEGRLKVADGREAQACGEGAKDLICSPIHTRLERRELRRARLNARGELLKNAALLCRLLGARGGLGTVLLEQLLARLEATGEAGVALRTEKEE